MNTYRVRLRKVVDVDVDMTVDETDVYATDHIVDAAIMRADGDPRDYYVVSVLRRDFRGAWIRVDDTGCIGCVKCE